MRQVRGNSEEQSIVETKDYMKLIVVNVKSSRETKYKVNSGLNEI